MPQRKELFGDKLKKCLKFSEDQTSKKKEEEEEEEEEDKVDRKNYAEVKE